MKLDGKKIKPGQRQMITQAWEKHRKDQIAVSADRFEINEVWHAEWDAEMKRSMNETFVTTLQFPSPFVTEVYTDTEPVAKAARQLGLHAGDSLTLKIIVALPCDLSRSSNLTAQLWLFHADHGLH